jgi:phage/plasmid-associated DNA primase
MGMVAGAVPDSEVIQLNQEGERGLAELLAKHHQDKFRYDHTGNRWMRHDGGVWRPDETKQVRREAIQGVQARLLEVSNRIDKEVQDKHIHPAPGEEVRRLEKTRDALRASVKRLNKKGVLEAVLDLAQSFAPAVTNEKRLVPSPPPGGSSFQASRCAVRPGCPLP